MKRIVTIKDVAKRANVAVSTVSRVLNGLDRVSPQTREIVLRAASELNYTPNKLAVSMVTGQTKVIMVIIPDFINSFYSSVTQGIESLLKSKGFMVMVCSTGDIADTDLIPMIRQFQELIDGAILIPTGMGIESLSAFSKPLVFVDRTLEDSNIPSITADDRKGTRLLTEELLRHGHRDIAIISGTRDLSVCRQRLAGYYDALNRAGISPDPDYVCLESMYESAGYLCVQRLLHLPAPPTAIIASNNLICIGCIRALQEMGKSIGKDISLVGFDDHPLARALPPGITVVTRPSIEMGKRAAQLLIDVLEHQTCPKSIVMDVTLVRRGSIVSLK